ncbi:MAG: tetratricopeptide repeat protein [Bacteroidetes bacterium]|nr:tetratricopeptide repeat protein [Bacteroidota bacterium]
MRKLCLPLFYLFFLLPAFLNAQNTVQKNHLKGRVLFQSSGNKPAVGVQIKELDSNGDYSKDNGDYRLVFQTKRSGSTLAIEVGPDTRKGEKIEVVNDKEIRAAKLPANVDEVLDIIVCPAGQRDIAAQKYYRILRTAADRELEKKKREVDGLLAQKEKDYQKISDLFAQLDKMQAALDSVKIREQAFDIASINLDQASEMVKDAMKKMDEENDVEGALAILNVGKIDSIYLRSSNLKKQIAKAVKKLDDEIKKVIMAYETRISFLGPLFKYQEIAECYENIIKIYENEDYDKEQWSEYIGKASVYWANNGEFQKIIGFYQRLLTSNERPLSKDSSDLLIIYSNLAGAYCKIGDYQKSVVYHEKAMSIKVPQDNLFWASVYSNLGLASYDMGNYQAAIDIYQRSLEIQSQHLDPDDLDCTTVYDNIAAAYMRVGDYQKAQEFTIKSLEIREKKLPANHPDLAHSYFVMSSLYIYLGILEKAKEFNNKALNIQEKTLRWNHPELAGLYSNMGVIYSNLKDYEKAIEFYMKSLAINESILPPDHPEIGTLYCNLAMIYRSLGNNKKALDLHQKALSIREISLPYDHPELAQSYSEMALCYLDSGENEKAIDLIQKSISIREKKLSPNHPELGTNYNNIGVAYGRINDFQKAIYYCQKALAIRENIIPVNHSDIAGSNNNLAGYYLKIGLYEESLKFNLKALEILEKNPQSDIGLAITYGNTGLSYGKLGDYNKQLEYNLKSLDVFNKSLPENHPNFAACYTNLGCAYRDLGDYIHGIEYGQKAVQLGESLTPYHRLLNRFYANLGITYLKAHENTKADMFLSKSVSIKPDETAFRGWAMYYALRNEKKQAIQSLQKAVSLGFKDVKWLETEPDLKNIRKEKGYKDILAQLKKQ